MDRIDMQVIAPLLGDARRLALEGGLQPAHMRGEIVVAERNVQGGQTGDR